MPLFDIILDNNPIDRPFHPGDRVRGKVTCRLESDTKLGEVSIVFKGKVHSTITRSQLLRADGQSGKQCDESIQLFRKVLRLHPGGYALQYQWPFEFTFPFFAGYDRTTDKGRFWESVSSNVSYCHAEGCVLPPSYSFSDSRSESHCEATVAYTLKVKMNESRTKQSLTFATAFPGLYSRDPVPVDRVLTPCNWRSELLRPKQQESFARKMLDTLTFDPSICFTPILTLPNGLHRGQSSPVLISIEHRRIRDCDPIDPTLILTSLTLNLHSHVRIRVRGAFFDYEHAASRMVVSNTYSGLNVQLPLDGGPVVALSGWNVQEHEQLEGEVMPNFSTWTIGYRHTLEIAATFEHRESGHQFKVAAKHFPFEYLPECHAVPVEEPPSLPVYELGTGLECGPPTYDEVLEEYIPQRRPQAIGIAL